MKAEDRIRLAHMLEAVRDAEGFVAGRDRADLKSNLVWKTMREDLPPLRVAIESALGPT